VRRHGLLGYVDTLLSDHGYQWLDRRPRGGVERVRLLHGPDGRPIDLSMALARIEAAADNLDLNRGVRSRRFACRSSCCVRRHRL
jgi:hypothetical protein